MSITTIFTYITYSIILYIITEIINYKKINNLNKIIITLIYLLIISIISKEISTNIFLVVILEFALRLIISNYIYERSYIKTNPNTLTIYLITIFLSYLLNITFINKTETILPTAEELKIIIWLLISYYLIINIKNNLSYLKLSDTKKEIFTSDYVIVSYAKLKNKYYHNLNLRNKNIIYLIYSIMIYNDYYKPKLIRKIASYKYLKSEKSNSYGIMQIKSSHYLTDEESIDIAKKNINNIYNKLLKNKISAYKIYKETLKEYLQDDNKSLIIIDIYQKIINFEKK